jgi:1,4-alpha-glucan branching enzyme
MVTVGRGGQVTFRFNCRTAEQLYVVGDFNGWDRQRGGSMQREAEGHWMARMWLEPGTYHFKYVTNDGRWFNDHAAFGLARGPFGWNSTVVVDSPENRHLALLPPYRRTAARRRPPVLRQPKRPAAAGSQPVTIETLRAILPGMRK